MIQTHHESFPALDTNLSIQLENTLKIHEVMNQVVPSVVIPNVIDLTVVIVVVPYPIVPSE